MTTRKVKCYGEHCIKNDIKHSKSEMKKISGKNYCRSCYTKYYDEISERNKLYKYVAKVYGLSTPTPLMKKHIKELNEQWSYRVIYAIIKYNVEVEKNIIPSKYGLRYYSNNYQDAIKYYKEEKRKKNVNSGKKHEKIIVHLPEDRLGNNRYKNSKFIDMSEL